nr:pentatricopeptide repeat-containing protein At5g38730 [Solanum lycopersicum]XP_019069087.1 pentatricopeptide repeat-containing protein At5g38730 [Solanum lycopersicum]XP_019069088.1 pentatricopeptide repeat-containing protein At5g38730 [Solanum lycopersicum]XP_019069089.1 pentatricopeptide repeat-containing protein At5g38730 [Solanum lycopersicum]XP_019069090.1 pentatricopeptide repeat-containing protein At5g38730 [Solanum lycopersicum]XP_019069091.1 pentatricopeptide repeat-containing prot
MANLIRANLDNEMVKAVAAVVFKGHWDNLLKPKIGSSVTSTTIRQALLHISQYYFSLSWSFFQWAESVPSHKHSLQSSWTMMYILTKQKHFKTAQDMLQKVAVKNFLSSPTVLNALVRSNMNNDVNSHLLSWLVIFYANSKLPHDAIQVFEHMRVCKLMPHTHACSTLLNSLVKDGLTDTLWKIYKKMQKIGVLPNIYIYNVLMHACCKSGDVERADDLLREMEFKATLPDLYTYNTLISLYCKKGMHYEALCVQDRMERAGVCPDIVTYNSLIYSYCREGRMREAMRLFKEIKGSTTNLVTYTTLIDGYCRANNVAEALRLKGAMETKGLYPGVVTYNSILRKLCEQGQMKDANILLNEMNEKKVIPDNVTCNTLINGYCKIGDMESALKVKNKMLEGGLKPDRFTYNAMIHGFCKVKDTDGAKEVLFDMVRVGLSPSYCSYSWLVDAYCHLNNEVAVVSLPDEFAKGGHLVDVSFYRAIIRRLCRRGKIDGAEKVFHIMQTKGVLGDSLIYATLAYAFFMAGKVDAASYLLDDMYKRRLMITLKMYKSFNASYSDENTLLNMFWSNVVQRGLISRTVYDEIQSCNS